MDARPGNDGPKRRHFSQNVAPIRFHRIFDDGNFFDNGGDPRPRQVEHIGKDSLGKAVLECNVDHEISSKPPSHPNRRAGPQCRQLRFLRTDPSFSRGSKQFRHAGVALSRRIASSNLRRSRPVFSVSYFLKPFFNINLHQFSGGPFCSERRPGHAVVSRKTVFALRHHRTCPPTRSVTGVGNLARSLSNP